MGNEITENETMDSCGHEDSKKIAALLPDDETLYDLAELYKIFGDSTRIKLLYILFEHEMCVYHIAELLGVTQSAVSHQLRILKTARLVKGRRDGKTIFYSLADEHVRMIIDCGMEHLTEHAGKPPLAFLRYTNIL